MVFINLILEKKSVRNNPIKRGTKKLDFKIIFNIIFARIYIKKCKNSIKKDKKFLLHDRSILINRKILIH